MKNWGQIFKLFMQALGEAWVWNFAQRQRDGQGNMASEYTSDWLDGCRADHLGV